MNSIDVVIPTYNNDKYIVDAINSVNYQTLKPKQIIVIDDGSTDGTKSSIRKLLKISKIPIKYIWQKNQGLSSARNRGIKESNAEYIAFLDSDDLWDKEKLELQLQIFISTQLSNLGLVYTNYAEINKGGKLKPHEGIKLNTAVKGNVEKYLANGNYITGSGSAVLIKRKCFDQVGIFDESLPACEDWDMWIRIANKYQIDYHPKTLTYIRKYRNSLSTDLLKMASGTLLLMKKNQKIAQSYQIKNELVYQFATDLINNFPNQTLFNQIESNYGKNLRNNYPPRIKIYIRMIIIMISKVIMSIRASW